MKLFQQLNQFVKNPRISKDRLVVWIKVCDLCCCLIKQFQCVETDIFCCFQSSHNVSVSVYKRLECCC